MYPKAERSIRPSSSLGFSITKVAPCLLPVVLSFFSCVEPLRAVPTGYVSPVFPAVRPTGLQPDRCLEPRGT